MSNPQSQNGALIATPLMIQEAIRILGTLNRALLEAGHVAALSSLEKLLHHAEASASSYEGRIKELQAQALNAKEEIQKATVQLNEQLSTERLRVSRAKHDFEEHNVAILALVLRGPLPAVKLTEQGRAKLQGQILPVNGEEPFAQPVAIRQKPGRKAGVK